MVDKQMGPGDPGCELTSIPGENVEYLTFEKEIVLRPGQQPTEPEITENFKIAFDDMVI